MVKLSKYKRFGVPVKVTKKPAGGWASMSTGSVAFKYLVKYFVENPEKIENFVSYEIYNADEFYQNLDPRRFRDLCSKCAVEAKQIVDKRNAGITGDNNTENEETFLVSSDSSAEEPSLPIPPTPTNSNLGVKAAAMSKTTSTKASEGEKLDKEPPIPYSTFTHYHAGKKKQTFIIPKPTFMPNVHQTELRTLSEMIKKSNGELVKQWFFKCSYELLPCAHDGSDFFCSGNWGRKLPDGSWEPIYIPADNQTIQEMQDRSRDIHGPFSHLELHKKDFSLPIDFEPHPECVGFELGGVQFEGKEELVDRDGQYAVVCYTFAKAGTDNVNNISINRVDPYRRYGAGAPHPPHLAALNRAGNNFAQQQQTEPGFDAYAHDRAYQEHFSQAGAFDNYSNMSPNLNAGTNQLNNLSQPALNGNLHQTPQGRPLPPSNQVVIHQSPQRVTQHGTHPPMQQSPHPMTYPSPQRTTQAQQNQRQFQSPIQQNLNMHPSSISSARTLQTNNRDPNFQTNYVVSNLHSSSALNNRSPFLQKDIFLNPNRPGFYSPQTLNGAGGNFDQYRGQNGFQQLHQQQSQTSGNFNAAWEAAANAATAGSERAIAESVGADALLMADAIMGPRKGFTINTANNGRPEVSPMSRNGGTPRSQVSWTGKSAPGQMQTEFAHSFSNGRNLQEKHKTPANFAADDSVDTKKLRLSPRDGGHFSGGGSQAGLSHGQQDGLAGGAAGDESGGQQFQIDQQPQQVFQTEYQDQVQAQNDGSYYQSTFQEPLN